MSGREERPVDSRNVATRRGERHAPEHTVDVVANVDVDVDVVVNGNVVGDRHASLRGLASASSM